MLPRRDAVEGEKLIPQALAAKLRERRVAGGAMLSKKLKVKFSLDDKQRPIDCEPYETKEANSVVEEVSLQNPDQWKNS